MAVRIRLRRIGKRPRKRPFFRIIVSEKKQARDGRFIEEIGYYNPSKKPALVKINRSRYEFWVKSGAQPSQTVRNLAKRSGGKDAT